MKLQPEVVHSRIAELLKARKRFVVATILEVKGSCPQKPGARMIVHPDGSFEFTIGGGTFEAEVQREALAGLDADTPFGRDYKLTKPELGMYCQGLVKVWYEPYAPQPQLLIFGGGHVGQALSRVAASTQLFHVIVVDDRKEYASREKHPNANHVILTNRHFTENIPEIDPDSYVVIVTRCHATDKLLIHQYGSAHAAYIGVIGSRPKIRQFRNELQKEGVPLAVLDKLHAPIGLAIGGKNPAEIAISILAEIIQVKNQKLGEVPVEVSATTA